MKKSHINAAMIATLSSISFNTHAILQNGDSLSITPQGTEVVGCLLGNPTPPCADPNFNITELTGSFFTINNIMQSIDSIGLTGFIPGNTQSVIDNPWSFSGISGGVHITENLAPFVVDQNTINMQGWTMDWAGQKHLLSGLASMGDTGLASISCGLCNDGDAYTLDYSAHFPSDSNIINGLQYELHLEGFITSAISQVPAPSALWLFCSGLLGIVGITRKKNNFTHDK